MSILMKDSGIKWIGDIPENWKVKVLKRVLAEPLKYGANEVAEFENNNHPRYIRITDFGNDGLLKDDTFKSLEPQIAEPYLLNEGDVLFARSGATVGKTFQFKNYKGKACFAGYLIKANPQSYLISSDFLYYFTKSPAYDTWKESIFTQATIQNIGADKYAYLPIVIPAIKTQKRITEFLDKATLQIDDAIKTKEKQLKTLEALKKSIIYKAVTKGLDDSVEMIDSKIEWIGDIPKHWNLKRVKDFSIFSPSIGNVDDNDEVTVVPMELVSENGNMSVDNILELKFVTKGLTPFQNNDVIMAKITPCMENGKAAFVNKLKTDVALGSTEFFVMRPIEFLINGKFLYYCIFNEQFRKFAEINMTGAAGQKRVPSKFLKFSKFPFPFKIEQEKIEKYLDTEVEKINTLKENVKKQIDKLKEYKKSLIYEYVTGKKQIKG